MGKRRGHRQDDVLHFVQGFVTENGFPPTYEEIREAVGLSSRSHVSYYLCALEQGGLIERRARRPRGLRLVGSKPASSGAEGEGSPCWEGDA